MSDVYDLMNSLEEKMKKAFQRADRSAIQRAVITGRAAAARAIQKHNTLKIGKIKQSVNVTVSSIKSGSLIKYSGEHIPLLAFGATLTSEGLRVKVNRNGNSEILKHAFIKPTKKYPIGIYERVTTHRVPLEQKYGPSIPQIIKANDDVSKVIDTAHNEAYCERLEHNVMAILNGWWEQQKRTEGTREYYRVKKRAQDMGINVEVALQRYLKGGD